MEQSRKNTLMEWVLGERQEQIFCHDSALTLEITIKAYLEILI